MLELKIVVKQKIVLNQKKNKQKLEIINLTEKKN